MSSLVWSNVVESINKVKSYNVPFDLDSFLIEVKVIIAKKKN